MISPAANITSIQLLEALKSSEAILSGKPLPGKDSLVEISILGKTVSGYRLLIDGNVFQAKLPFTLNPGEFLFAKVISTNPFTLSLDNLFTHAGLSDFKLIQLLSKLNIRNSDLSRQVLKALIDSKKPVIKSRLDKLIDIIEKENLKLDDSQFQFLLQVLDTTDHGYEQLNGSYVSLFQHSLNALSSEILNYVCDLTGSAIPESLKEEIDNALIVHIKEDSMPDAITIKKRTRSVAELIISLDALSTKESMSETLRDKINGLLNALIRYTFLKANYQKAGIYRDFIIAEEEGDFKVLDYKLDHFGFEIKMQPEALGRIFIDGYVSGNNAKIDFTASETAVSSLESSTGELKERLVKNIRMNTMVSFKAGNASEITSRRDNLQGINVAL